MDSGYVGTWRYGINLLVLVFKWPFGSVAADVEDYGIEFDSCLPVQVVSSPHIRSAHISHLGSMKSISV